MRDAKNQSRWLCRHRFLPLAFVLAAAVATSAQADTNDAFGPQDVVHPRGRPTTETLEFDVLEPGGPYLLQIRNGGTGGELGRVSLGWVWLNGTLVVRPPDFWRHEPVIEKPVTLAASNTLKIKLAGRAGGVSVVVIQEKTEYLEIEAVLPVAGETVSIQRGTGWPLSLRLRARSLVGIAVGESTEEGPLLPGQSDRAFLVFDSGADGFFEPLCSFPNSALLSECAQGVPPDGEVFLEFTLDTDRPGVEDSFGNDEVRDLTDSGEFGVPEVVVGDDDVGLSLTSYGPATGGNVTDGYGYGPNDDLPGLVVLSDTGAGVFFTEDFDLVEPREARNLAGFFDTVSYELKDPTLGTSVVASMTVPRFLFSPFTLYDTCLGTNTADCPTFTTLGFGREVLARTDGGPVVGPVAAAEINDEHNAREVTLTIFAVNGTAPLTLSDENGDGRVDSVDAQLAGFELLSRETILRFRQFYDVFGCGNSGTYAGLGIFDFDGSGAAWPQDAACPGGAGGLVEPP